METRERKLARMILEAISEDGIVSVDQIERYICIYRDEVLDPFVIRPKDLEHIKESLDMLDKESQAMKELAADIRRDLTYIESKVFT